MKRRTLVQTKNAARRVEAADLTGKRADQGSVGRHPSHSPSASKESADIKSQGHESLVTASA